METEGEATTVIEDFTKAITFKEITSEAMTLGKAAFIEIEVKLDQIRSTIYVKSQDAD
jgi:hypothetical protein